MEEKNVSYDILNYGFPIVLLSYYDENGIPNYSTINSTFTLGNTLVLGLVKDSLASKSIKYSNSFCINIPDYSTLQKIGNSSFNSGINISFFEALDLSYTKSEIINAPLIDICKLSIECAVLSSHEDESHIIIISTIKSRKISKDILRNDGTFMGELIDSALFSSDGYMKYYKFLDSLNSIKLNTLSLDLDKEKEN